MKQYYFSSLLTLLVFAYFPLAAQRQNTFKFPSEGGLLIGATNYAGDIVKKGDFDPGAFNFNFGAFYRLYATNNLSWRFGINQGKLSGDDRDWEGTDRIGRGFHFSTAITEISARAEFDFLNHLRWSTISGFKKTLSFYLFVGGGVGLINPKTYFNPNLGARYDILIAQDKENHRTTVFTVPFGGGIKLDLSKKWSIGGELGLNPVFNDYLDGISLSADPNNDDWYASGGLTLSYRIHSNSNNLFFIR